MTKEEQLEMAAALIADTKSEPVQMRFENQNRWIDAPAPTFNTLTSDGREILWRPQPKEPIKRWEILYADGQIEHYRTRDFPAERAKELHLELIELTETKRESFKQQPEPFWAVIYSDGSMRKMCDELVARDWVKGNLNCARVAKLVEVT